MTKKFSTKRTLVMSVLSLVLCISMLLGTTFAWFTDSVTSANNVIKSGNLNVELYYQAGTETENWTKVTSDTNVFMQDALWEPGHVEVIRFKVVNEGNLSLKYQLGVNIVNEIGSQNIDGKDFELSDFIMYAIVDGAQNYTRDEAVTEVEGTAVNLKTAYNSGTNDLAPSNEELVTMVVYMPTSVGNEANAAVGAQQPTIDLGINLFATQYSEESDSFGTDYDKNAWVGGMMIYSAEDLVSAVAEGEKNVVIMNDIELTEAVNFPATAATFSLGSATDAVVLNLNGHKLTGSGTNVIYNEGNLVIEGKGEIVATKQGYSYAIRSQAGSIEINGDVNVTSEFGCVEIYNGSEVTINNGNYYAKGVNGMTSHTVYVSGSTLTVNGGTFDSGYSSEGIDTICGNDTATVTLNGGTFYASELGANFFLKNATINGGAYQFDPTANTKVTVTEGYESEVNADGMFVVSPGVNDTEDLKNAIAGAEDNATIYLDEGEFTVPSLTGKQGVTIVGAADGSTAISGVNSFNFGEDTTMKNVTFKTSGGNSVRFGTTSGDVVYENCVFEGKQYGYHVDNANDGTVTFNNCTFYGRNALASNGTYFFNDCTFKYTYSNYNTTNIYSVATFNNCKWDSKLELSIDSGAKAIVDGDELTTRTVFISDARALESFQQSVNWKNETFSGVTVMLSADIDMNEAYYAYWTPIGQTGATQFQGTFDGHGYTIKNLNINTSSQTGAHYSTGLFGWLNNATVKNLTIENATVTGNHNVGVIAGYMETSGCTISNCHVVGATVTAKHANDDACGDKVGVIVGHAGNTGVLVENCTATNCVVNAGRDAGQIAGAAMVANVVNCSAENVTVTATGECTGANIKEEVIGRVL